MDKVPAIKRYANRQILLNIDQDPTRKIRFDQSLSSCQWDHCRQSKILTGNATGVQAMQSIHAGAYDPRLPAGIMMPPKGGWSAGLASTAATEPSTRTQSPIVTGTGVIGVKYNGGVMIAADCLGTSSRSTAERRDS